MTPVHSAPKARIRVAARARETPKSASRSRRMRQGPVERLELCEGVWEGEEPPGASGHLTTRATRGGRESWEDDASACLTPCYETVI